MPKPLTVGDVWKFNAAAGWIREDLPLFAQTSSVLTDFITRELQGKPKCNMVAVSRIKLRTSTWGAAEEKAWEDIRISLEQSITTSYRDRRMRACLFTDASKDG